MQGRLVVVPVGVDVDGVGGHPEVAENPRPHLARDAVVGAVEREVAEHAEGGEVGTGADQVEVVGADATLERAVNRTVRRGESVPDPLHARTDEEGGGVVGDDPAVGVEGEAVLLEPAEN
jgi:hypothetical protein